MWVYNEPKTRFFSDQEVAQLSAVFGQILPADPVRRTPGAKDANAVEYVNRLLAMGPETYREIPVWQNLYKLGLPALDEGSKMRFGGRSLDALTDPEMQELLTDLAARRLTNFNPAIDQAAFFALLRLHCIQGCFADPRWGGNKDRIMWRWIGYLQEPEAVV